jgi:hypothetical protein
MQLCYRTSSFLLSTPRRGVRSMLLVLLHGARVLPSATCPVDALPSGIGRSLRAITAPVPSGCEKHGTQPCGLSIQSVAITEILDVPLRHPSLTRSASAANTVAVSHVNVPVWSNASSSMIPGRGRLGQVQTRLPPRRAAPWLGRDGGPCGRRKSASTRKCCQCSVCSLRLTFP